MLEQFIDIDWFFIDKNDVIVFVASGGGILPNEIKNDKNYNLREYFNGIPNISEDYFINEKVKSITGIHDDEKLKRIIFDFISITKKGIYSFDKSVLNNLQDANYHLVSSPSTVLKLQDLPENIQRVIKKTCFNVDIKKENKINLKKLLF